MKRHTDLIFDVGMHRGEDTEFYLKKGFRVIGFEADPQLAAFCRQKFAVELDQGRLVLVEGAVAPENFGETLDFYASSNSVWGSARSEWAARNENFGAEANVITVKRTDIFEIFKKFGIPFYLKIDIEGMDRHLLDQVASLPLKPTYISIESEKADYKNLVDEFEALRRAGYASFKIVQQMHMHQKMMTLRRLDGTYFNHRFALHSSGPFGDDIMQPWAGYDEALQQFEGILEDCHRSGDFALERANRDQAPALLNSPGWFDTHAKLEDLSENTKKAATLIVTCKNRLAHLRLTLAKYVKQKNIDIILVDYGCQENSGNWTLHNFPSVKVVFVSDDPLFSLSRARNIGALHADTDYLIFADADTYIDFSLDDWLAANGRSGEFYTISSKDPALQGVSIINRYDFFKVGGFDEAFRGWGFEDTELYFRLDTQGVKKMLMSDHGISSIPHDDSLRQFSTKGGGSGSKAKALMVGELYTKLKFDLLNNGKPLIDLEQSLKFMETIRHFVNDFFESGKSETVFSIKLDTPKGSNMAYISLHYHLARPSGVIAKG